MRQLFPTIVGFGLFLVGSGCDPKQDSAQNKDPVEKREDQKPTLVENKDPADKSVLRKPQPAPKVEHKTPATPRAAMIQMTEALYSGNEEQLLKALEDDPEGIELKKVELKFLKNIFEFKAAFVKAYGEEAWSRFNDPKIDPGQGRGNATITLIALKDRLDSINKSRIEEKGDVAFADVADVNGKTTRWKLIKVKDGWVVEGASASGLPKSGMAKAMQQLTTFTDILKRYRVAIGQPGVKPDDLDVDLGKTIVKDLLGVDLGGALRLQLDQFKQLVPRQ